MPTRGPVRVYREIPKIHIPSSLTPFGPVRLACAPPDPRGGTALPGALVGNLRDAVCAGFEALAPILLGGTSTRAMQSAGFDGV